MKITLTEEQKNAIAEYVAKREGMNEWDALDLVYDILGKIEEF